MTDAERPALCVAVRAASCVFESASTAVELKFPIWVELNAAS